MQCMHHSSMNASQLCPTRSGLPESQSQFALLRVLGMVQDFATNVLERMPDYN